MFKKQVYPKIIIQLKKKHVVEALEIAQKRSGSKVIFSGDDSSGKVLFPLFNNVTGAYKIPKGNECCVVITITCKYGIGDIKAYERVFKSMFKGL